MRASIAAESAGIPSVSLVCEGFVKQAAATGRGHGYDGLPLAVMPGHVDAQSAEAMLSNLREVAIDQLVTGLTEAVGSGAAETAEPTALDVAASGTIDEINRTFVARGWSDGSPIIPPTREPRRAVHRDHGTRSVATDQDRSVVGREVTMWSIAVKRGDGRLSTRAPAGPDRAGRDPGRPAVRRRALRQHDGCRRTDRARRPVVTDLGFNHGQGALREGTRANTTVGRWLRCTCATCSASPPTSTTRPPSGTRAKSCSPRTWLPWPTSDGSPCGRLRLRSLRRRRDDRAHQQRRCSSAASSAPRPRRSCPTSPTASPASRAGTSPTCTASGAASTGRCSCSRRCWLACSAERGGARSRFRWRCSNTPASRRGSSRS